MSDDDLLGDNPFFTGMMPPEAPAETTAPADATPAAPESEPDARADTEPPSEHAAESAEGTNAAEDPGVDLQEIPTPGAVDAAPAEPEPVALDEPQEQAALEPDALLDDMAAFLSATAEEHGIDLSSTSTTPAEAAGAAADAPPSAAVDSSAPEDAASEIADDAGAAPSGTASAPSAGDQGDNDGAGDGVEGDDELEYLRHRCARLEQKLVSSKERNEKRLKKKELEIRKLSGELEKASASAAVSGGGGGGGGGGAGSMSQADADARVALIERAAETKIDSLRAKVSALTQERDHAVAELASHQEASEALQGGKRLVQTELQRVNAELDDLKQSLRRANSQCATLESELAASREELRGSKSEVAAAADRAASLEADARAGIENAGAQHQQALRELRESHRVAKAEFEKRIYLLEADLEEARSEAEGKDLEIEVARGEVDMMRSKTDEKVTALEGQVKTLEDDLACAREERDGARAECAALTEKGDAGVAEARSQCEALERRIEDMRLEFKIGERKQAQLVKQLKAQLQREIERRERAEQGGGGGSGGGGNGGDVAGLGGGGGFGGGGDYSGFGTGGDGASSGGVGPAAGAAGAVTSSSSTSSTSSSSSSSSSSSLAAASVAGSGSSSASSVLAGSGNGGGGGDDGVDLGTLTAENEHLAERLGSVQADKWAADERIRGLEAEVLRISEELDKKSSVIQHYVAREQAGGLESMERMHDRENRAKRGGGVMASLFARRSGAVSDSLAADMAGKMESVLEETLLQNIRLQQDLETMGSEVSRLLAENRGLRGEDVSDDL